MKKKSTKKHSSKRAFCKEIIVAPVKIEPNSLFTLSFFSGVRGLDIGAKKAGFTPLFLSDREAFPGKAFELNIPSPNNPRQPEHLKSEGVYVCGKERGDITKLNFGKVRDYVFRHLKKLIEIGEIDVIHGGPPCQDVSKCNNHRRVRSKKNRLIFELLRLIREAKPKVGLIEQVPDLLSEKYAELWTEVRLILNRMTDYIWDYRKMNAMDYGARQNRTRLIIMLVRRDLNVPVSFPEPVAVDYSKVAVQFLLPEVYHFSPGQYLDGIKSAKDNVFCTMTASGSEYLYGLDGIRRKPEMWERLVLTELEGLVLTGISATKQKTLVGNMVQISLAEALFRHIRTVILKVAREVK